jgi:threonine dehydrogenase-like Zn-dependent dehydrogenase
VSTHTRTLTAVAAGDVEFVESGIRMPGPGEIAGTTLASVLSPGTEISMAYPAEPRYPFPTALGYSAVFRIDAVGDGVADRAVGDIVMSTGPHASRQVVDAAATIPVPPGLDPRTATFSRIMNIPMSIVASSAVRSGVPAGVIGLGLIGQLTVRVLAASGFLVSAADTSLQRRALVDGIAPSFDALPRSSVDLVVECSGHEANVLAGARALRAGGELSLAGVPWRRRDDTYFFDVGDLVFHNYLTLRSGWEWQVPFHAEGAAGGHDMVQQFATSMAWLESGAVSVDGLSTQIRPDGIVEAYESIRERRSPTLTYVVDWT